jgi:hypothetical protein
MGLAALPELAAASVSPVSIAISLRTVAGVVGGLGDGVTNDGAARSLARANFAASICAFKLGFAINS